ncbi:hypothetical protein [Streptomyces sp. FxanaA7]|nr:hypothetical protein [Streptomyces sp. FxanaA7]
MSDIEYPSDLIELERAAWREIQEGALTVGKQVVRHAEASAS